MSLCQNVEVVCTTTCTELPWRKGSMTSREKIWLDRLLRTCDLLCKDVFAVCLTFRKCGPSFGRQTDKIVTTFRTQNSKGKLSDTKRCLGQRKLHREIRTECSIFSHRMSISFSSMKSWWYLIYIYIFTIYCVYMCVPVWHVLCGLKPKRRKTHQKIAICIGTLYVHRAFRTCCTNVGATFGMTSCTDGLCSSLWHALVVPDHD